MAVKVKFVSVPVMNNQTRQTEMKRFVDIESLASAIKERIPEGRTVSVDKVQAWLESCLDEEVDWR